MRTKLDRDLLRSLAPKAGTYDILDTDLPGFLARVTPSGVITYGIRYCDPRGKQRRESLKLAFPSVQANVARAAAKKRLAEIELDIETAKKAPHGYAPGLTLRGFIDEHYADWLTANTKSGKLRVPAIKAAFPDLLGRPIGEITGLAIEKWRTERLKAGISPSTTNRNIASLRGVFSRAVEWGLLAAHPLQSVKMMREPGGKVRWLSDDEEARLRAALEAREARERTGRASANEWRAARNYELLPDLPEGQFVDYLRPMILLSLNTGARQGELVKLRWDAVDLDNAVITFHGDTTKSGATRHIPLNSEALETLKRWHAQSVGSIVFAGRAGDELVEIKTAWNNLLKKAKITAFRWHDMRHHFASRLVMAGVDLNTVRELLGHSDLKMTLRYAHLAPEHKAAAVQKLMRTI